MQLGIIGTKTLSIGALIMIGTVARPHFHPNIWPIDLGAKLEILQSLDYDCYLAVMSGDIYASLLHSISSPIDSPVLSSLGIVFQDGVRIGSADYTQNRACDKIILTPDKNVNIPSLEAMLMQNPGWTYRSGKFIKVRYSGCV